ncbi:hypothetical protein DSO57_1000692 [Entomophthora muscae]|uniref:Uncharacterized protein n=1 Tax=Entomophthora muscae TaxID=34485 RepID=A0ACC2SM56_9FUNG|nr:hypothetical protein DSO57_1000692 [Entomophthora muscae]
MGSQQSHGAAEIPITVGLGGVAVEMKLPPSTVWNGNQGEFGSKHVLHPGMMTAWPQICFKKKMYITHHTFCFKARHVEFYWGKPTIISSSIQCPPNKLCSVTPNLSINKKAQESKPSEINIVKLLAKQIRLSLDLTPVYEFNGILKSKPLSFMGPGISTFVHLYFISISPASTKNYMPTILTDLLSMTCDILPFHLPSIARHLMLP